MRTLILIVATLFVAGCASTPMNLAKVYDRKSNTTAYVAAPADADFVGTSAAKSQQAKPVWWTRAHP